MNVVLMRVQFTLYFSRLEHVDQSHNDKNTQRLKIQFLPDTLKKPQQKSNNNKKCIENS